MAYALTSRLKSYGVLAAGVFDQDRKFSFPIERISSEEAQVWMITNILAKECDTGLHNDVDVLVMDRSPLCLLAYYAVQYRDSDLFVAFKEVVIKWLRRKPDISIYYLDPLPYQDDGKRPDDDFRMLVDKELAALIGDVERAGVTVKRLERHKVLEDVLLSLNIKKPGVKDRLTRADVQAFANVFNHPILLKPRRNDADIFTDDDMWLLLDNRIPLGSVSNAVEDAKKLIRSTVGPYVQFDLNCAAIESLPNLPEGTVFYPGVLNE